MNLSNFTSCSNFSKLSLILKEGNERSGIGANQSVSTDKTLCSKKANCKSCFFNCDITFGSIEILLTAGFSSWFSLLSSSAAFRMSDNNRAIMSSLSLMISISFRLRRRVCSSFLRDNILSKSDRPSLSL